MQYLTKATTGYDLKRSTHNHMILHATRGHGRGNSQPAIVLDGVAPRHATVPDGVAPHHLPRHATVPDGVAPHDLTRHATVPDGVASHDFSRNATVRDGVVPHQLPRHATVPDGVAPHDLPRHATLRLWILERHGDFPDGLDEPTLVLGRRDAAVDTEDLTSKAQPTGKRFFSVRQ